MKLTALWMVIWLAIVLGVIGYQIAEKEHTVAKGRVVLLKLAPVDPRSLMQGDYMTLRYDLAIEARKAAESVGAADGKAKAKVLEGLLVVKLDADGVATFVRFAGDTSDEVPLLYGDEVLIKYRNHGGVLVGAESFFFQEGDATLYEKARYGELKVSDAGETILVGLRDETLQPLGKGWGE